MQQYLKTAVSAPTNLHGNKRHPTVLICFITIFSVQNQLQSRPQNCSFANRRFQCYRFLLSQQVLGLSSCSLTQAAKRRCHRRTYIPSLALIKSHPSRALSCSSATQLTAAASQDIPDGPINKMPAGCLTQVICGPRNCCAST